MREHLDLSPTRFYQILNALLEDPAALAYAPTTVREKKRADYA